MSLKNELPIVGLVLLPFVYLAFVWNQLPEEVPVHWNFKGEIDRYSNKTSLLLIPILLPLLTYLIFTIIPKIDPKNNLNKMGNKFQKLKFALTAFMSVLALFIIYSAKNQSLGNPNYLILLVGLLYIILGNYFKTIKPNYFIGIRTPWTLENDYIWQKTHKFGGILWFFGGLIIIILSLVLDTNLNNIFFLGISAVITILPILYAYLMSRADRK